jgi:hypothetical protein
VFTFVNRYLDVKLIPLDVFSSRLKVHHRLREGWGENFVCTHESSRLNAVARIALKIVIEHSVVDLDFTGVNKTYTFHFHDCFASG